MQHAGREHVGARPQDARQLGPQEMQPLPHRNAAIQQEGADLIDDGGALANQSLANPVQRLQVELVGGLGRDELHGGALHRLGDRFRIAIVVLLTFRIGAHVLRRHQPGVVTKCLQAAAEMMRADAGFHPDQARWQVGEPCADLAAGPLLSQHDRASPILAHDVARVLADIDANHGDFAIELQ
jgi:hypothetical protein